MLTLTGLAPLFDLVGWVYWGVGALAVWLAWRKIAHRRWRVAVVAGLAIVFSILPALDWWDTRERKAYARAARAHYEKLCAEKSGIKIYRKVSGVRSLVVLKPLPQSTDADNFNQHWYGDPYSGPASEMRQRATYASLVTRFAPGADREAAEGFDFVEVPVGGEIVGSLPFARVAMSVSSRNLSITGVENTTSRFGVSWEDISSEFDRRYWVAGSRLTVIDTVDQSIVATRIGYFIEGGLGSRAGGRRPWLTSHGSMTTCPESSSFSDRLFLIRALDPRGAPKE